MRNLTSTEMDILCFFLKRPGVVLSREAILEGVWLDGADQVNQETVERHIQALRTKLGAAGKRLETIYGRGYVLRGG